MVKNTATAEDIIQEAFLSAYRSMKSFRQEVPFSAWLRRIVINKSLDHLRRNKNSNLEYYDKLEDFSDISHTDSDNGSDAMREKLVQHIKDEMMLLPDGYRVIFSLFYFEGYDHDEIGQIMNISPSSSRSQLTRAKQRIIRNLNQKGIKDVV